MTEKHGLIAVYSFCSDRHGNGLRLLLASPSHLKGSSSRSRTESSSASECYSEDCCNLFLFNFEMQSDRILFCALNRLMNVLIPGFVKIKSSKMPFVQVHFSKL